MDEGKLYWSNIYILEFSNFQWTKKRRTKTQQQRLILKLIVEYVDSLSLQRERKVTFEWIDEACCCEFFFFPVKIFKHTLIWEMLIENIRVFW